MSQPRYGDMTHVFVWRNNPVRERYCGCRGRIIKSMARNSVLIEFMNGNQLITSRHALRKEEKEEQPKQYRCESCGKWFDKKLFSHSRTEESISGEMVEVEGG